MTPRPNPLNPTQQLLALRRQDPRGKGTVHRDKLQWETQIRPTPISRVYRIRLTYQKDHSPKVKIISPSLKALANGRHIPHLYDQQSELLCLYLPGCGELDYKRSFGLQLIPWAAIWLYYFEEWLESDDWKGGGAHPPTKTRRPQEKFSAKTLRQTITIPIN